MIRRRFLHPLIVVITVVGAALGLAVFDVVGLLLGGLAGYGAGLAVAVMIRHRDVERIDPFALGEPWRFFVRDALQARNRFRSTVAALDDGPMAEHLRGMVAQVDAGVDECWRVARRGQSISDALHSIKREKIQQQLDQLESVDTPADDRRLESLRSQIESSDHLGRVLADAERRLQLLDVRLEQSVTRAIALSTKLGDDLDLSTVEGDMNELVDELGALRQALDETDGTTSGSG